MVRISRSGVTVNVPAGWEAEMYDYSNRIVLHMSDFPLPGGRSDFGGEGLEAMGSDSIFVAVLEYDPSDSSHGLFHRVGRPAFVPRDFSPDHLHHQVNGQSAAQKFFTLEGRTFCCYVIIARRAPLVEQVSKVNQALHGLSMSLTG